MIRRMNAYPLSKPTRIVILLFLVGILSLIVSSCKEEAAGPGNGGGTQLDPATIQGTIFSALDSTTLQNAIIVIAQTFANTDTFLSDAQGKYNYVVQFPDTISSRGINLSVMKDGFYSKNESFVVKSGFSYTKNYYLNVRVDTSGTGGGGTGKAASIVFVGANPPQISVRGAGGNESSIITFVVKDKNGRSLPTNAALVNFQVQPLGTGAIISPDSARTNAEGLVRATLTSGTVATVIQIQASTDTGGTALVMSSPVPITIAGGLPDSTHFSIAVQKFNLHGLIVFGLQDEFTVFVGDRYGNPVQKNTAVYFTTTGGIIGPSAYTNDAGSATVTLYTANPIPVGGVATITASTVGEGGKQILDSAHVVFSGFPIISPPTTTIDIQDGSSATFGYTVQDINGNPMVKGTKIDVSLEDRGASQLKMSGDVSVILDDYLSPGPGRTVFSVTLQDTVLFSIGEEPFSLVIKVDGDNGRVTRRYSGRLLPTPNPPEASIKKIALIEISSTRLTVTGVGGLDTSNLTYEIQDSIGNPIRRSGINVFFSSTAVDATFNPQSIRTDSVGRVKTTFRSGTVAEVVRLKANAGLIESPEQNIVVEGGPPTPSFFTISLIRPPDTQPKVNFPGSFPAAGQIGAARVQVKDRYGNVVKINTPIYFSSNAGFIIATAYTDASGIAQAGWRGGTPIPPGGTASVKAEARDALGNIVTSDSVNVTYSGQAIISGGLSPNYVFLKGIDTTIDYSVKDINNNPLAEGARIKVTATGPGGNSLVLSGDVDVTTIDTRSVTATSFSFRVRDTNTVISTLRPVSIGISVTGANGEAVKQDSGSLRGISLASVSALTLESISNTQITVIGGNDPGSTVLTYQLRDSLGNPIPKSNVLINFEKYGVAGRFNPESTYTDANGKAQTTFHSDTVAGIVQLFARTGNIISNRVKIVIVGGKPSQQHFTFVLSRTGGEANVNYPGAVPGAQQIGVASVRAGDQYGNPVPSGTPIYFTTTAGVIQGTASTDGNGKASVNWFGGNPPPPVAIVKASALGSNGQIVSDSAIVTYSGLGLITGGLDNNFVLRSGIDTVINYRVKDSNGNPIAQGSTILVTASESGSSSLILTGDINVTSIDTRDTNETYLSFRLRDSNNVVSTPRNLNVTIQVTGPNGSNAKQAVGTLQGIAQTAGRSRLPGSIALISVSTTQIQVVGTGGVETSTLIWEVRDSLGVPVDSAYIVHFSMFSAPGGGAFISPDSGLSGTSTGRINSIVHAGTVSGVIQVIATVGTIVSSPVRIVVNAGFPDTTHFSIGPAQHNFAGYNWIGRTNEMSVQVGDKYSNPVAQNTAIYFNTTGGIITTTAFTDATGHANATLYSGNPLPRDPTLSPISDYGNGTGYARVKASTRGEGGSFIEDSTLLLFSGVARITVSQNTFAIARNGSINITVTIDDQNGNPLAPGTSITTNVEFSPPEGTNYSATASGLPVDPLGDYLTRGPGRTQFTLRIADGTAGGTPVAMPVVVTISVNGTNGPASATITGTVGP